MAATKQILTSIHGKRLGLSPLGNLIVEGRAAALMNDAGVLVEPMAAPTAKTVAVTLTSAELLTKYLTGTHTAGATAAYALPTGTLLEAAIVAAPELAKVFAADQGFRWELINLSAAALDTITMTAGNDHTLVGAALIPSNHVTTGGLNGTSTSRWRTRRVSAGVFVTYRG
jgi:hypothetical protein